MTSPRDELKRRLRMAFVVTLAATLGACDNGGSSDDSDAPARPLVAGFNAVPNMGTITFLREEERWTDLEYGEGTEFRDVGADQYDLNFDNGKFLCSGAVAMASAEGGTRVTFSNEGQFGMNPVRRYFGLFIDRMMGRMFENNLQGLKQKAESKAN